MHVLSAFSLTRLIFVTALATATFLPSVHAVCDLSGVSSGIDVSLCGDGVSLSDGESCSVSCIVTHGFASEAETTVTCNSSELTIPTCYELAPDSSSVSLSTSLESGEKHITIRTVKQTRVAKIYFNQPSNGYCNLDYLAIFDTDGNNLIPPLHMTRINDWNDIHAGGAFIVSNLFAGNFDNLKENTGSHMHTNVYGDTSNVYEATDRGFVVVFNKPTMIDRIEFNYRNYLENQIINAYLYATIDENTAGIQGTITPIQIIKLATDRYGGAYSGFFKHHVANVNVDQLKTPTKIDINGAVSVNVETVQISTYARYLAMQCYGTYYCFTLTELEVFDIHNNKITTTTHALSDHRMYQYLGSTQPDDSATNNMFDGNINNEGSTWHGDFSVHTNLVIDLGGLYKVGKMRIYTRPAQNYPWLANTEILGLINFDEPSFKTTLPNTYTGVAADLNNDWTASSVPSYLEFTFPGNVQHISHRIANVKVNGLAEDIHVHYPFGKMDLIVQNGQPIHLLVDGLLYTQAGTADFSTFTTNSLAVTADNSRWSYVAIGNTKVLGSDTKESICGDNIVHVGEACDDGNIYFGDGCDTECAIESRHECSLATLYSGANFKTSECLLYGTKCGDGFIDNSAYFHTQQQYRRIPFTAMQSTNPNVTDPDQCAVAYPDSTCSFNTTQITFPGSDGKHISKQVIYASSMPVVKLYSLPDCSVGSLISSASDSNLLTQYIVFERPHSSNYLVAGELEIFCDGVQVPINELSIVGDARNLLDGLTNFINNVNESDSEARLIDGRRPDTADWSQIGVGSTYSGQSGNQVYGREQYHPSGSGYVWARIVVKLQNACKVTGLKYWGRTTTAYDTWWLNDLYGAVTEQDVINNNYQWKIALNDIKNRDYPGDYGHGVNFNGPTHCYSGCDVTTPIQLNLPADITPGAPQTWTQKVTPNTAQCVEIEGANIHSIKLYEAIGHVEECDGENYCDSNCQLLPTAYCHPRPPPVPTLLFDPKRSAFQYNSMYSAMMTSMAGLYDHWPRLVADDTFNGVIVPSNYSNKLVLQGYDVEPAGGKLLIGTGIDNCPVGQACPVGTWTAIIKMTSSTTKIATFLVDTASVDNGRTLELVYQHGVNSGCPDGEIPSDASYAADCPQFKLHCTNTHHCNIPSIAVTYKPKANSETLISVAFTETTNTGRAEINFGDATLDVTDQPHYGGWFRHTYNPSDRKVYLQNIYVSNFDYLAMSAVYENLQVRFSELRSQLNHQDTYGAGRECAFTARAVDGVVDVGEDCDDGNFINNDGCVCTLGGNCVYQNPQPFICSNVELWTGNVNTIAFTADAAAKIEEVQFFSANATLISPTGNSGSSKLHDGMWNTRGNNASLSATIHGATFTFSSETIEYIRIYNTRSGPPDNSHLISTIKVSINGALPINVGFSSNGEWTCSNSESGFASGDCTDSKYPGFVDLMHDAQQTTCQCDVRVTNGSCGSYDLSMPMGQSCNVTCDADHGFAFNADVSVTCNAQFSASSVPTCHPLKPHTSASTVSFNSTGTMITMQSKKNETDYKPTTVVFDANLKLEVMAYPTPSAKFAGVDIVYPFVNLFANVKSGTHTIDFIVEYADGYVSKTSSSIEISAGSRYVQANSAEWNVIQVGDKTAFGNSFHLCGDGVINANETCDDGTSVLDGCSASCTVEDSYNCFDTTFQESSFETTSSCLFTGKQTKLYM